MRKSSIFTFLFVFLLMMLGLNVKSNSQEKKIILNWWGAPGHIEEEQAIKEILIDTFEKAYPNISVIRTLKNEAERRIPLATGDVIPDIVRTEGPAFSVEICSK